MTAEESSRSSKKQQQQLSRTGRNILYLYVCRERKKERERENTRQRASWQFRRKRTMSFNSRKEPVNGRARWSNHNSKEKRKLLTFCKTSVLVYKEHRLGISLSLFAEVFVLFIEYFSNSISKFIHSLDLLSLEVIGFPRTN